MTQLINQEIDVHAFYFSGRDMKTFPKAIEWNGRSVTFAEAGLRLLVQRGEQLTQLFDMTDGSQTYRLKHEGARWTLVGTRAGA
ncbi:MAG TPA: hypothetical protein VF261_02495 [Candidatus Saccharimonadales bacterium]